MLALAKFTLKGPFQAAAVVALLAALSAYIVPMIGLTPISLMLSLIANLLAVVLVGLIVLTQGVALGSKVILGAALAVSLMIWAALDTPGARSAMLLLQWVPVILLAQSLRSSRSLAMMLLVGVAIGTTMILLQNLYWAELEAGWFRQLLQRPEGQELSQDEIVQHAQYARLVMILLVSSMYLMYVLVLFIARWLQTRLEQSDDFKREFCSLTLGKPAAIVAIVAIVTGLLLKPMWLLSFALLMLFAFMFQGIAIVHSWLSAKQQPTVLFVLYYVLLVFTWQITGILTSLVGMVDNWVVLRRNPGNPNNVN